MKVVVKVILAIVGPTGVGKTKLSIKLAQIYNGEIINCDAMQVYKHLNVGTAKVSEEEMEHIPHHLLSIKELDEEYNAYLFQQDAREKIKDILNRGKVPILVGGTGYYLKAALYDYQFNKENDDFSSKQNLKLLYKDVYFIGLTTDRKTLYDRINKRFDQMLVPLLDEIKPYMCKEVTSKPLKFGIGYKEFIPFFNNEITLEEAVAKAKQNSCNYAKRQYTWFNNQMNITWFNVNYDDFQKTIDEVVNYLEKVNYEKD